LIYHVEQLIRLTGYSINGTLEIVNEEQWTKRTTIDSCTF
jgi:hypothetical protein